MKRNNGATGAFTLLASVLLTATACSSSGASNASASASDAAAQTSAAPSSAVTVPPSGPKIRIVTTAGTIVAVLDPKDAPKTVANFLRYVDRKFYNGGTFFRAIPGFVIQGGNKPKESPSDVPIALEDTPKTGLKNLDGSLAMARTGDPDSATSEFFIDDGPQPALDGTPDKPGYAAFGVVVSGMDVVRKIVALPANGQYLVTPVTIVKIERVR